MTEQEAIERLDKIYAASPGDDEMLHCLEDELMTEIIASFGWTRFMDKYSMATHARWCA